MATTTRNAILRALIEGAIVDLMVKTKVDNVYVDDSTTLAAKLAEIITSLNSKATATALSEGLAAKSDTGHGHSQSEVSGLASALSERPTAAAMNAAIADAINGLINGAPGTYDTLKEIADYIAEHDDVVDALNAAIGSKADAATVTALQETVNALGSLSKQSVVYEDDLETALRQKITSAVTKGHTHGNYDLLETYTQTESALADAVSRKHSHSNKSVLDSITAAAVSGWNGKGKFYAQSTQPSGLAAGDLWAQLI